MGIFRWIEGQPWRSADLADPHATALEVVAFIRALQAIDPGSLPGDLPPRLPSLGHLDEGVRAATAAAAERGLLADPGALLGAWDVAVGAPKWQGRRPLLHSDLLAGNLLVRDGRLAAVIDWSSLAVGDPARELMATWNLFATDEPARATFRDALPYDDATWARARGWALTRIVNVAYYERSNPEFSVDARRAIAAVLGEVA